MLLTTLNDPDTTQLLQQMRALPQRRLTQIEVQGQPYFVKMPETGLSLRWRLQKGNPKAAFAREINLLRKFAERGAPVARIVAGDDTRIAMADHGTPVRWIVYRKQADPVLMRRLGTALAEMHALGLAHGRPSLRDICWNGKDMTFLDLEAGAKLQATPRDQARDLYLLIHSVFNADGVQSPLALPVLKAYRAQCDPAIWEAAKELAQRLWWVDLLSRPGAWVHRLRGKSRSEFAAIRAARSLILRA
ncbi:MAG: hypothetical protein ACK4NW_01825 [Roseinatronobacter sp.]